jgi:hypothetical protein
MIYGPKTDKSDVTGDVGRDGVAGALKIYEVFSDCSSARGVMFRAPQM